MENQVFTSVIDNIQLLISHAPDLILTTKAFGRICLHEALTIATDWNSNINLANQFLSNPAQTPSPLMMELLNEYKEVRELDSWNNLGRQAKVQVWSDHLYKDLRNLKINTGNHISRLGR